MAIVTLSETVGSASANTYQTVAGANTYFESRLGGEQWPSDNTDTCTKALYTAMRVLEGLRFIGRRVDTTQALNWPREANNPQERGQRLAGEWPQIAGGGEGLYAKDGKFYDSDAIPQPVKDAQCEIAYAMLLDPSLNDPALIQATLKTGNLSIDHSKAAASRLRMAFESLQGLIEHGTRLNMSL